jgi:hypothetical protein
MMARQAASQFNWASADPGDRLIEFNWAATLVFVLPDGYPHAKALKRELCNRACCGLADLSRTFFRSPGFVRYFWFWQESLVNSNSQ